MGALVQDLRYALRQLRKSPGFTSVAILTLALGIGANTGIFTIVNAVLLRPLPYPNPDRLVAVYNHTDPDGNSSFGYLDFLEWQRQNQSFASLATYRHANFILSGARTEHVPGDLISAEFFDTLGVRPLIGRTFNSGDDHLGSAPVALIGEGFGGADTALNPLFWAKPSRWTAPLTPSWASFPQASVLEEAIFLTAMPILPSASLRTGLFATAR